MRTLTVGFAAAMLLMGGTMLNSQAFAGDSSARSGTVVELFTSQGCSSCPPADRLLGEIANRKGVIALTFPVDYWDYLGWKDTLASHANTVRQQTYAAARGDGQVYTPQVVINGLVHAVGSRSDAVDSAISEGAALVEPWHAPLDASITKGVLTVSAGDAPTGKAFDATVWIAEYRRSASVAVKRGENAGGKLTYTNVVRRLAKVGEWNGKAQKFEMNLAAEGGAGTRPDEGCVVFLQKGEAGPIIAAVELRDWNAAY